MKNLTALTLLIALPLSAAAAPAPTYTVVTSSNTLARSEWRAVVDALQRKHDASMVGYATNVQEALPELRRQFPRYACFVACPEEASREFVAQVHRLTRAFDDDPYADCFWGILTGYDATNALHIAQHAAPLTVRKVAAGTEVALEMCDEGVWYCELKQGHIVRKEPGKTAVEEQGPADSTAALVSALNDYHADLFVTSGHATEHDWMIGFRYRNGFFKHDHGQLFGLDTANHRLPVHSPNPKLYLPIGNCLMGHIDRPDCMATAWMNSAGVHQMIGYTVPTWYGYAGWGCLDYFVEQPGRYTFVEAFFANQAALIHRLAMYFPDVVKAESTASVHAPAAYAPNAAATAAGLNANDGRGLLYDRDGVALYGDPAWAARMDQHPCAWDQTLTERDGLWTFEIKPNRGADTFKPINTNGSQRGGRPIVQFLPERIRNVRLISGDNWQPVITDNFILVPNPGERAEATTIRIRFQAE